MPVQKHCLAARISVMLVPCLYRNTAWLLELVYCCLHACTADSRCKLTFRGTLLAVKQHADHYTTQTMSLVERGRNYWTHYALQNHMDIVSGPFMTELCALDLDPIDCMSNGLDLLSLRQQRHPCPSVQYIGMYTAPRRTTTTGPPTPSAVASTGLRRTWEQTLLLTPAC